MERFVDTAGNEATADETFTLSRTLGGLERGYFSDFEMIKSYSVEGTSN